MISHASKPKPAAAGQGGADQAGSTGQSAAVFRKEIGRSASLAAALSRSGIEATAADSADALRDLLTTKPIKLLIVDNQIGGFFTGLEVIRKLRSGMKYLPALLLDKASEKLTADANSVGAVTVLDSDAGDDEIVKAARRLISRRTDDKDRIPLEAQAIVERHGDLPVLSHLTFKLLEFQERKTEEVPVDELSSAIALDPKATAVVLKAANASANGLSRELAHVPDAVRVLGVRPTITTVLNAAVTSGMGGLSKGLSVDLQSWHARRGMLIASTSSTVARELEDHPEETAFLLGILQDVGMLLLIRAFPKEYRAVLKRWQSTGHLKLGVAEQAEFGCTHAAVSAAIMKRWGLPTSLSVPVLNHLGMNNPSDGKGSDPAQPRALGVAESLADLIDAPHPMRRFALNNMFATFGVEKKAACLRSLKQATVKASQAFQILSVPLPSAQELETMLRAAISDERAANKTAAANG